MKWVNTKKNSANDDEDTEAVTQRYSIKKRFLEISQNSQENTCAEFFFFIKLQATACKFIKKPTLHRSFLVNFAKFLRTPFFTKHVRWLLQKMTMINFTK